MPMLEFLLDSLWLLEGTVLFLTTGVVCMRPNAHILETESPVQWS